MSQVQHISLAGTGVKYAEAQMRVWSSSELHFQIADVKGNRKYGLSFTVPSAGLEDVVADIRDGRALCVRKSMTGSGMDYAEVQISMREGRNAHIQFRTVDSKRANRDYGFSFDVTAPLEVAEDLRAFIAG